MKVTAEVCFGLMLDNTTARLSSPSATHPARQKINRRKIAGGMKAKKTKHGCGSGDYGLMISSFHRGNGVENKREHNVHLSLKPDPNAKGSYLRRMQDIQRALDALEADKP